MSGFVDAVRADIRDECHAEKCRDEGCDLKLDGLDRARVLIAMNCDELGLSRAQGQKKCDFVFVGEKNWVVPIELKGGSMEASEVAKQLRAGAGFAEQRIARLMPAPGSIHFRPVVAFRGTNPHQRAALRHKRNRVSFRNVLYEILPARCGASLAEVVRAGGSRTRPSPKHGQRQRPR